MSWTGSIRDGLEVKQLQGRPTDSHWLLVPLNTLTRRGRWLTLSTCTLAIVLWSALRSGNLAFSSDLPDVLFYVDTAYGRYDLVPQPFSARPLAPLFARCIAFVTHASIERGFVVLAYLSLLWTVAVVFWLLLRSGAPRWFLLAVAAVPFWPGMRILAGLPDPLYSALLATLLLTLEYGWLLPAAALLFPLMLARESTWLTLVCVLAVAWRRLRWFGRLLAIGGALLGALIVHRFTAAGLPNPEHLPGSTYMVGKLGSNLLRSFGLQPWSNVYPVLCQAPVWQSRLHLGAVQSVGVCSWDYVAPTQAVWALLTTFGVLPSFLVVLWRRQRTGLFQEGMLVSFCLLYGGSSVVLAPALGTWYARLFAYGWPLFLVAVPRVIKVDWQASTEKRNLQASLPGWGCLMVVHLLICAEGNRMGWLPDLASVVALQATAIALLLVRERVPRSAVRAV